VRAIVRRCNVCSRLAAAAAAPSRTTSHGAQHLAPEGSFARWTARRGWQKEIPRLINDYSVVPSERTIDAPSPWARSAATAVQQFDEAIRLVTWLYEFRDFQGFARLASWPLEPRRTMIAELQSMRRLEFLFSELNRYRADIPSPHDTLHASRGDRSSIFSSSPRARSEKQTRGRESRRNRERKAADKE
jgi:hypothetical protein